MGGTCLCGDSANNLGCVLPVFGYLWFKFLENPTVFERDNVIIGLKLQRLCIPDTIVYMPGEAAQWFFTSISGEVLKKNSRNVTSDTIFKAMCKGQKDDIVAQFVSACDTEEGQHVRYLTR